MKLFDWLFRSIFYLGASLMLLNFFGLFIPLRNPAVELDAMVVPKRASLSRSEFFDIMGTTDDDAITYARKMTVAVHQSMVDYWYIEGLEKYNLRVPLHENWLLYLVFSFVPIEHERMYEFCDYRKAIERGVGFCSQQSMILDSILDANGIESNILEFPNKHVVVTSRFETDAGDQWWILDPDMGVVIEADIETIQANPEMIRPYYRAVGHHDETIDYFVDALSIDYKRHRSVDDYFYPGRCDFEKTSYMVAWGLPSFFILVGIYPVIRKKDREKRAKVKSNRF